MDDKTASAAELTLSAEIIPLLQDGLTPDAFLALSNDDALTLISKRQTEIDTLIASGAASEACHAMTASERAARLPQPQQQPVLEPHALDALTNLSADPAPAAAPTADAQLQADVAPAPQASVDQPAVDVVVEPAPAAQVDAPQAAPDAPEAQNMQPDPQNMQAGSDQAAPEPAPQTEQSTLETLASDPRVTEEPAPIDPASAQTAPVAEADATAVIEEPAVEAPQAEPQPVAPAPEAPAAEEDDDGHPTRAQLLGSVGMFCEMGDLLVTELDRQVRLSSQEPDQAAHAALSRIQTAVAEFRNTMNALKPSLPEDFGQHIFG